MTILRSIVLFCPATFLLAQTPPPKTPPPIPEITRHIDVGKMIAPTVPADRVVITAGDVKITAAQFDQLVESLPEQYRAMARTTGRKQFGDNIVQILTLAQEGQRRKINETTEYKTLAAFQLSNVLAALAVEAMRKDVKVEEADLRKYYDQHKSDYEQVHGAHILVRFQGSQVPLRPGLKDLTDAEALAKAQELRAKIVAGADFADLAKKESDDIGSGNNGGDLGTFKHGQMVPSFEAAAFKLKPGELSEPIKTQFGYHLIRVQTHDFKSFEDARAEVETKVKPDALKAAVDELGKKSPAVFDPEFFSLDKK
ncbi:MAG: peptidylprolyl isomerase [Bryobacteraceae bacterium]|jgi:peptidyl-prolyl cis-trans isomerase C